MPTTVEYVQNKEPFTAWPDGTPRTIRRGEIITTDDPIYKGREHLFETLDEHAAREAQQRQAMGITPSAPVERMTAAPGERRRVHIPEPDEGEDTPKAVPGYQCDQCEFASVSERGLKIHQRTHDNDE